MFFKKNISGYFILILSSTVFATCDQSAVVELPPKITFMKTYGEPRAEEAYSASQTRDGGYILAGYIYTQNYAFDSDVVLLKVDAYGNQLWKRIIGGAYMDIARSVLQTKDGGYIIVGATVENASSGSDVLVIKTDEQGVVQWQKTFDHGGYETANKIIETDDGGFLIVGRTFKSNGKGWVLLIKSDTQGNRAWIKSYGAVDGPGYSFRQEAQSVQQTKDGGYIIAGYIESTDSNDPPIVSYPYVMKTNSLGDIEWEKKYTTLYPGNFNSVDLTNDDGYIFTGYSGSSEKLQRLTDAVLMKTDSRGNQIWLRYFGGDRLQNGWSVEQTHDGGFIIGGYNDFDNFKNIDAWLIKTDANGNPRWTQIYGGKYFDFGLDVHQTSDGGYILAGYADQDSLSRNSDFLLIKTDGNGALENCSRTVGRRE